MAKSNTPRGSVGNSDTPAMLRFYHRPNIGDVLYSLPVIRQLGRGILYLDQGPEATYTIFEHCLSFLKRQPYVKDCRLYGGEPYDYDLETYRKVPEHQFISLVNSHFRGLGLEPPKEVTPWLVAKRSRMKYPVVIHRSARYHGEVDYNFLHYVKKGDLFCVGFEEETRNFRQEVGAIWIPTPTLDDLATVVNGCSVFIGNQSSPLAIAVGLGKNRLFEECPWSPNCTFNHENEIKLTMDVDANFEGLCRLGYVPTA